MSESWSVVSTANGAKDLVDWIADTTASRPWVVVTIAMGEMVPRFEMESLVDQLAGVASISLVTTVEATRAMTDLFREREDVFAGAARVYPAGYTPENPLKPTPLRLVHPNQSPSVATQRLISDALGLAQDAGVFEEDRPRQRSAVAEVNGFIGDDRAFVQVQGGEELATLAGELTCQGVPLSWLFAKGQSLKGNYDASSKRFLVEKESLEAGAFLEGFPLGGVTLGLVTEVDRQKGALKIHPGHTFTFRRAELSPNPKDRVDLLLAEGEVLPVRVYRNQQGVLSVRMDDIDDDEDIVSPPDFGAGPWLVEDRELVDIGVEELGEGEVGPPLPLLAELTVPVVGAPARPKPGPGKVQSIPLDKKPEEEPPVSLATPVSPRSALQGLGNQLHSIRADRDRLQQRLKGLGADRAEELFNTVHNERDYFEVELARAQAALRAARADLSDFRKRSRSERGGSGSASGPWDRETRFASREDWLREEVHRTWVSLYTPQEREIYALVDDKWSIGEDFGDSLRDLKNSQLRRLFKLIVHIASGRNGIEGLIEVHPLRTSDERNAGPHSRVDGSVCMRAYVEEGVPQSRRLHYWKRADGLAELSRVVLHDDMSP